MFCIDGHLDLAYNGLFFSRDIKKPVADVRAWEAGMIGKGRGRNTVCLPDMRRGNIGLCFSTINARHATGFKTAIDFSPEGAWAAAQGQLAFYDLLERQGALRRIRTQGDLEAHLGDWERRPDAAPIGHVLCIEGADCLLEPHELFAWWRAGLRILSLAHYGTSHYAHGTSTEGGLFPPARELLEYLERLGVILDLTHTSDGSFWEALEVFGGRVIATHNNCRALVPRQRQFTDDMIRAIAARDGVIGVALDDWMLSTEFEIADPQPELVTLDTVVDHVVHICTLTGSARHVAIGTDLDGGYGTEQTPSDLDTIADLQKFPALMRARGLADADIEAFMHGNWLRVLRSTLPA
jgi:membrane dipeptidase